MSCLLSGADSIIRSKYGDIRSTVSLTRSLLYANATLIIESHTETAQEFMDVTRQIGTQYGLSFNENKLEVLSANSEGDIVAADGRALKKKDAMVYLGSWPQMEEWILN